MIGGFSFVFERVAVPRAFGRGKRPVNERVSATHLGNERIAATHLGNERVSSTHLKRGVRWEARGQTPASSQNEGEESIAGGSYKRNVEEAPLPFPLMVLFGGADNRADSAQGFGSIGVAKHQRGVERVDDGELRVAARERLGAIACFLGGRDKRHVGIFGDLRIGVARDHDNLAARAFDHARDGEHLFGNTCMGNYKGTIFRLREGGMHELHVRIHDEVAADGGAQKLLVGV